MPSEQLTLYSALALLLQSSAITLLWANWRRRKPMMAFTAVAWALIGASLLIWQQDHGGELGSIYLLLGLAALPMMLVALQGVIAKGDSKPLPAPTEQSHLQIGSIKRISQLVLLTTLLGALVTVPTSIALVSVLPMARSGQMVVASLLFPIIWAITILYLTRSPSLGRSSLKLLSLPLLSAIVISWAML